jgi:hypothetical protein
VAIVPLNFTILSERVVEKLEPMMVTSDPQKPELMLVDRITGFLSSKTLNSTAVLADLLATVTVTNPLVAPVGTITDNEVDVEAVIVAFTEPKLTLFSETLEAKFFPVISTAEPTTPLFGVIAVISGVKGSVFASRMVTSVADLTDLSPTFSVIGPLVAPEGTFTVRDTFVADDAVALVVPKYTRLSVGTSEKFFPIINMEDPAETVVGENEIISGVTSFSFVSSVSQEITIAMQIASHRDIELKLDAIYFFLFFVVSQINQVTVEYLFGIRISNDI